MRRIRFFILIALLIPCGALAAVTLTIGNEVAAPNASDGAFGATRTDIDLVHPASHSGAVNIAKLYWSAPGCSNAFKIKFFRRVGDTLTMTAERGPFSAGVAGTNTVALTPSVNLQQGDLIGVARISTCGNAGMVTGFPSEGYLQYSSDVTGAVDISAAAAHQGGVLALSASGTASESMVRVIPIVGSAAGAYGSYFRTEMQFFNPQTMGSMTCKLVFHPAGVAGSSADTTRLVVLDPGEVFSTADVVAAMGQTGTGSLDISVPINQGVPMLMTRVYNDAGPAGTSGLTEEAVEVSDTVAVNWTLLARGVTGFLVAPRDPARTRFNIGVRTLYSGATLSITQRNKAGAVVRGTTRTYTATYFIQTDVATFVGGPVSPDDTIQITVSSGSAIIYGSTTDNTTNDPAIQFAYGLWAIA